MKKHETRKLKTKKHSKTLEGKEIIKSIKNQTCHIISIIHKFVYKYGTRGHFFAFEYFWNWSYTYINMMHIHKYISAWIQVF